VIVDIVSRANPKCHALDLLVETNGMMLVVRAGDFVVEKEKYQLGDDSSYNVPSVKYEHLVIGYLAKEEKSGLVELLVEDIVGGIPKPNVSSHDIICMLFWCNVPPNERDLGNISVNVIRYLPEEEGQS
jgi:hypothetical protein